MNLLEKTLTSLEVAEMVGREHYDVMKDIRRIIQHLGEGTSSVTYFIENNYKDVQGKERPSFNLTKKGCELYSTRMTGERGTQFAVAYIECFNKMENELQKPMSQAELALLQAQNVYELEQRVERHDSKIVSIEKKVDNQITLDHGEQRRLQKAVARRVYELYENPDERPKAFSGVYREIKDRFAVASYKDVRRKDLQSAINYVENWIPRKEAM